MSIYRGIGVSNPWTSISIHGGTTSRPKSASASTFRAERGRAATSVAEQTIPIHHSAAFCAAMNALTGMTTAERLKSPGTGRSCLYRVAAIAFSVWSATGQCVVMRAAWRELTDSERSSLGQLAFEQFGVSATDLSSAMARSTSIPVRKQATLRVLSGSSPQFVVTASIDGVQLIDVTSGSRDTCITVASATSRQALLNDMSIESCTI